MLALGGVDLVVDPCGKIRLDVADAAGNADELRPLPPAAPAVEGGGGAADHLGGFDGGEGVLGDVEHDSLPCWRMVATLTHIARLRQAYNLFHCGHYRTRVNIATMIHLGTLQN